MGFSRARCNLTSFTMTQLPQSPSNQDKLVQQPWTSMIGDISVSTSDLVSGTWIMTQGRVHKLAVMLVTLQMIHNIHSMTIFFLTSHYICMFDSTISIELSLLLLSLMLIQLTCVGHLSYTRNCAKCRAEKTLTVLSFWSLYFRRMEERQTLKQKGREENEEDKYTNNQ